MTRYNKAWQKLEADIGVEVQSDSTPFPRARTGRNEVMGKPCPISTLKNGTTETTALVAVTMMSVNRLMDEGKAVVVFELVEMCRDRHHEPWGDTGEELKSLGLVSESGGEWHIHESIRNIVLSAAIGEGLDMKIGNPLNLENTPNPPGARA